MSKKFTDGEWEIREDGTIYSGINTVSLDNKSEMSMANARLVKAAPKMYKLLEEICSHVTPYIERQIREFLADIDEESEPITYKVPMPGGGVNIYALEDLQQLITEHKKMQDLLEEVREVCIMDTKAFSMREKASYKIKNFLSRISK